jgi:hypothetical protein
MQMPSLCIRQDSQETTCSSETPVLQMPLPMHPPRNKKRRYHRGPSSRTQAHSPSARFFSQRCCGASAYIIWSVHLHHPEAYWHLLKHLTHLACSRRGVYKVSYQLIVPPTARLPPLVRLLEYVRAHGPAERIVVEVVHVVYVILAGVARTRATGVRPTLEHVRRLAASGRLTARARGSAGHAQARLAAGLTATTILPTTIIISLAAVRLLGSAAAAAAPTCTLARATTGTVVVVLRWRAAVHERGTTRASIVAARLYFHNVSLVFFFFFFLC